MGAGYSRKTNTGSDHGAAVHARGRILQRLLGLRPAVWLTDTPERRTEPDLICSLADRAERAAVRAFSGIRADRILRGSVFLHPELWVLLTLLLLPFLPTLVMLVLSAVCLMSVVLRRCAAAFERGMPVGEARWFSPGLRLIGLLAAVYLLAIAASVLPKSSLYPGVLTAFFMLFAFSCHGAVRSWSALRRAFAVITLGAAAVSLYGFWQWLHPAAFQGGWLDEEMFSSFGLRVYSTFSNPNVLGEYFLLTIPFAAALALTAPNLRKKLLWGAIAAMMCLCAVLTYSRGCYIGLLLAVVVFLVLLDRRFLIPVVILALLSPLYLPASITERFLSIGSTVDTSTSYRVEIWAGVLAMLKHFWFCGIGPGEDAFNAVYPIYMMAAIDAPHSHCLYLQLICDTGIAGLVVFLLLAVSLLRSLLSALHHARRRQTQVFAAAGAAALCGFLLQSTTDYSFYNYRVLLLFFGIAGLCLLLRHEEQLYAGDGDAGKLALELCGETRPVILQILSDSNVGGAGRYLMNLFAACDRERYAMVLVLPRGGAMVARAAELEIPVVEADMLGEQSLRPGSILELRRICMLLQPELVQTHGSLSGRIAARACAARIVYTRHSVFPVSERLKRGPLHMVSAAVNRRYGDIALAVSPAAEQNLLEIGVRSRDIVTIMNGVAPAEPDPAETAAFRAQFALKPELFTAGIFARLEPCKGHETILEAAAALKAEGKSLQILICGAGPEEQRICEGIQKRQLEDTVFFCGYLSNPASAMAAVQVQLNASTGTEATSLALLEGMSMGIPVIASSYGGNPYLIHDGVEGLLFTPGDASGLAACLRRLMDDAALREQLGRSAQRAYQDSYTAEAFAQQLQVLYSRMLERKAAV